MENSEERLMRTIFYKRHFGTVNGALYTILVNLEKGKNIELKIKREILES